VLLLPALFTGPVGWVASGRGLAVTAYLAVVTTAAGYLLYARGLRTTPVTAATTLGLAEPAIAAVLGLTVLGEHLGVAGFTGLSVLALGLVILAWPTRRGKEPGASRSAGQAQPAACGKPSVMPYSDGRESSQVTAPASRDPAQAARRAAAGTAGRRGPRGLRQPGAPARPGADRARPRR
jgi:hypothetical protein